MLARGAGMIRDFRARGHALAAITTYTLESTAAICQAAERAGAPVIVQAGSSSFAAVGRELLAESVLRPPGGPPCSSASTWTTP